MDLYRIFNIELTFTFFAVLVHVIGKYIR